MRKPVNKEESIVFLCFPFADFFGDKKKYE